MAQPPSFKFACEIFEVFQKSTDDGQTKRYIRGRASGTNIDLEGERMAASAILAFKRAIDDGMTLPDGTWSMIPLRSGHRDEWDDVLGYIVGAEIDEYFNFFIEAELDPLNPTSERLYRVLTTPQRHGMPTQLGLSVGGIVLEAGIEYDEMMRQQVRTYYDVALREVSVVGRPANPTTYITALAKSVPWSEIHGRTTFAVDKPETAPVQTLDKGDTADDPKEGTLMEQDELTPKDDTNEDVEKTDETVVTEETVAKTDEGDGEAEEVSKDTDPLAELKAQMADVIKNIGTLADAVAVIKEGLEAKAEAEETTKSEVEETHADVVTKEAAVVQPAQLNMLDIAEVVKGAIADAIAPLKAQLDEIEKELDEPVDKSLAIDSDGPAAEETVLQKFARETEGMNPSEQLRRAFEMATRK